MSADQPIAEVVETLEDATHGKKVCVGDVLQQFGAAAFSSMLLAVALMLVSPLSGIPLFSSVCGLTMFLVAGQAVIGRQHIWLPDRLLQLEADSNRFARAIDKLGKGAKWLDDHSSPRLAILVSPPASRGLYAICALCGLLMPFMEIIPMASSLVGVSVTLISIGLLARDGLIAIAGMLVLPIAAVIPIAAVTTLVGS